MISYLLTLILALQFDFAARICFLFFFLSSFSLSSSLSGSDYMVSVSHLLLIFSKQIMGLGLISQSDYTKHFGLQRLVLARRRKTKHKQILAAKSNWRAKINL